MDTKIEWEHALAVTHYDWLTGIIEFCLENILFILWRAFLGFFVFFKEQQERQF